MNDRKQKSVCERIGAKPDRPNPNSIIGLATDTFVNVTEIIHGLRHPVEHNTNGWYIWCGEYSESIDFFKPVCLKHLYNYITTDLSDYLDLPPGYRFLIDRNDYEDVWFDENLLKI